MTTETSAPILNTQCACLAELGGYNIRKPLAVNRGVLDTVEKLLAAPACHEHVHSPLDIIDPMLAKTGHSLLTLRDTNFVYQPIRTLIRTRASSRSGNERLA